MRKASKRLCAQCHVIATHVEYRDRPAVVIKLDGSIHRFIETVGVYWCEDHTGIKL